ncbi:uncharacterized protein LOC100372762 [Saccoglossus kowalevskii]|uniref:Uncharacterized protein LOC100372762 n=1 Tax=Saccoglossus kowalevskii TaxID=10224 RepID=A0ABM0GN03_SACKO|nr:PREDICTED: uncharacterized protein LOC100372762 [Saccoglossus kowalevskii]
MKEAYKVVVLTFVFSMSLDTARGDCYVCTYSSYITDVYNCLNPGASTITATGCTDCMSVFTKVNGVVTTISRTCSTGIACIEDITFAGTGVVTNCCAGDLCNNGATPSLTSSNTDSTSCYICSYSSLLSDDVSSCKNPDVSTATITGCESCMSVYITMDGDVTSIVRSCVNSAVCTQVEELLEGGTTVTNCCTDELCNSGATPSLTPSSNNLISHYSSAVQVRSVLASMVMSSTVAILYAL